MILPENSYHRTWHTLNIGRHYVMVKNWKTPIMIRQPPKNARKHLIQPEGYHPHATSNSAIYHTTIIFILLTEHRRLEKT